MVRSRIRSHSSWCASSDASAMALATVETIISLVMLTEFIWVAAFLLPKARREHDRFGVIAASVAATLALCGWLLMGTGAR